MGKGAVGSALNIIGGLLKKEKICADIKPLADAVKNLNLRMTLLICGGITYKN
jgi:hypothetical protein